MTSLWSILPCLVFISAVSATRNPFNGCLIDCIGEDVTSGLRFPHCDFCHMYSWCATDSTIRHGSCHPSLNFNAAKMQCDNVETADCRFTSTTTATTTTMASLPDTPCFDDCHSAMLNNRRYPVCTSCSSYMECTDGANKRVNTCPTGLYHNFVKQNCDLSANVICTYVTTMKPTTTPTTTKPTTTPTTTKPTTTPTTTKPTTTPTTTKPTTTPTTTTPTTTVRTTAPPGICLSSCDGVAVTNRRYPHCSNCSMYIECLKSGKEEKSCPSGLLHDDASQHCTNQNVPCYTTTTPMPTTSNTICVKSCDGKLTGYYQHCSSCNKYVACVHERYLEMRCADMTVWDDKKKECLFESSTCK